MSFAVRDWVVYYRGKRSSVPRTELAAPAVPISGVFAALAPELRVQFPLFYARADRVLASRMPRANAAAKPRRRRRPKRAEIAHVCAYCGVQFTREQRYGARAVQRFCSVRHAKLWEYRVAGGKPAIHRRSGARP